jgi:hypothetical protein
MGSTAPNVVWLTTDRRTAASENAHIFGDTVKIPSTDRKLLWRAHHCPWVPFDPICNTWWGYAGIIPRTRITNITFLKQQPWHGGRQIMNKANVSSSSGRQNQTSVFSRSKAITAWLVKITSVWSHLVFQFGEAITTAAVQTDVSTRASTGGACFPGRSLWGPASE